jgi:4-aminobutyrate aminotransferase-like enzyme
VEAVARQMAVLNTNTRYLHENVLEYAERLTSTLPEPLRVCYFVNSGSEANELALRLARAFTGQRDVIVMEGGYHGNTQRMIEVGPYKFDGPGGEGRSADVHVVPIPDVYSSHFRPCLARAKAALRRSGTQPGRGRRDLDAGLVSGYTERLRHKRGNPAD